LQSEDSMSPPLPHLADSGIGSVGAQRGPKPEHGGVDDLAAVRAHVMVTLVFLVLLVEDAPVLAGRVFVRRRGGEAGRLHGHDCRLGILMCLDFSSSSSSLCTWFYVSVEMFFFVFLPPLSRRFYSRGPLVVVETSMSSRAKAVRDTGSDRSNELKKKKFL